MIDCCVWLANGLSPRQRRGKVFAVSGQVERASHHCGVTRPGRTHPNTVYSCTILSTPQKPLIHISTAPALGFCSCHCSSSRPSHHPVRENSPTSPSTTYRTSPHIAQHGHLITRNPPNPSLFHPAATRPPLQTQGNPRNKLCCLSPRITFCAATTGDQEGQS